MKYTNFNKLGETIVPDSIPVSELVKLIAGRILRIEQEDFVLIIHKGHLTFTSRDQIESTNKMIENSQKMLQDLRLQAFADTMDQMFGGI